tara:strand:- start:796 stop:939 length:144 start_codon:yes stop_codon:yes gene_type:complete
MQTPALPEVGSGVDKARFKMKMRCFVEEHPDQITLIGSVGIETQGHT